jgi:hypothetical protein
LFFNTILLYNKGMKAHTTHPAAQWQRDARQRPSPDWSLRLAAMAGHMRLDKVAARRAALIDLLADGRPHLREEIWAVIAGRLGEDCWGKLPREALARDLAALRQGGLRIAYSRRPEIAGYYLQYPPLERPPAQQYEAPSPELTEAIRRLSVTEKNERAFAAADFALRQKQLLLAEEHPNWSEEEVDLEARRLVFGREDETPDSVIIAKLQAYTGSRPTRHLEDIALIVSQQGSKLAQKQLDIVAAGLPAIAERRPDG